MKAANHNVRVYHAMDRTIRAEMIGHLGHTYNSLYRNLLLGVWRPAGIPAGLLSRQIILQL